MCRPYAPVAVEGGEEPGPAVRVEHGDHDEVARGEVDAYHMFIYMKKITSKELNETRDC